MESKVIWHQGLTFTGTADTGFTLPLGGRPEDGGANDGFRPLELILVGLAGCTGMDVISILKKKRQEVTDFEVRIQAERSPEHPKVFTHILVEYVVTGHNIDPAAVDRAIELSETKYCSAYAMLVKAVPIEHKVSILAAV
ncbi:MAG: OsmC family protein [Anaerolineaceae bacterium]|nr:OsmC family protein [Anaerolineaceae bacterium]